MRFCALLLSLLLVAIHAEMYKIHNMFGDEPVFESVDKKTGRSLGTRRLQLDVGTLRDINATTDTCQVRGAGIRCDVQSGFSANDGDSTDIRIQVDCPLDSQIAFDFRRAHGCACGAQVTSWDGTRKFCPCIVCPMGFGDSPVSIDCSMRENPFIISTCSFLDCGFACNGTCEFNCQTSKPGCEFCENGPGRPTPAPTGPDGSTKPPSLIQPGSPGNRASTVVSSVVLVVAAALSLWRS